MREQHVFLLIFPDGLSVPLVYVFTLFILFFFFHLLLRVKPFLAFERHIPHPHSGLTKPRRFHHLSMLLIIINQGFALIEACSDPAVYSRCPKFNWLAATVRP